MGPLLQNVIGKTIFRLLLPLLFVPVSVSAQVKYYMIPDQTDGYIINQYNLSTEKLYGIKKNVELFCLTFPVIDTIRNGDLQNPNIDFNIVLLSVLHDLTSNSDWTEINIDSVSNDLITHSHLKRLFSLNTYSEFNKQYGDKNKYFDEYQIIKKFDKKYYKSKHCLLQFFAVRNRPSVFQNSFGTINTEQEPLSVLKMEHIFKKRYPKDTFPLYTIGESPYSYSSFDYLRDRKEYLAKVIKLSNDNLAYQFWTYTNWHKHRHEFEFDRGIDRFVYLPGKGIIGGSFDFYFYFHRKKLPIQYSDFVQNIKDEKVMMADQFK
ncbi:hypothetical protein ABE545_22965 [Sphingobacterium faecium]|uniref:hypothetical protein n=1 Tax=Sphingobacterium faecium TaxID=34087 RepID=UPI003209FCD5